MEHLHDSFETKQERQVVIVTGLSGAGKSNVLNTLEDLGFYCVDNLPIPLISTFLNFAFHAHTNIVKVALGVDARGGQRFLKGFLSQINKIKKTHNHNSDIKIIFLNASTNTILKRFQTTRRNHPLIRGMSVEDAIEKERELLVPIKELADFVYDTDKLTVHDLRRRVLTTFSKNYRQELVVNLVSFGFKYGVPSESNHVYDLRFLPNPYFVPELRKFNGTTAAIQDYLFDKTEVVDYWGRLRDFLHYSVTKYQEEGRFFATIAIGCTGGKHRSVSFVERLSKEKWESVSFLTHHRDIGKE
jgi:RNase adapter protein RapZ